MEDNPFDWMDFVGIDKLGHLVFYCIFCMLVMWGLSKTSWRKSSALIALSIVTIYGIIMEILQYYFYEGRQMDFADVVANIVGATLGYFLFRTFLHKI